MGERLGGNPSMSLLQIIIWWLLGWLIGILGFIVAPLVTPSSLRESVAGWYWGLSMNAYRRVVQLVTPRNSSAIYRSKWEGERQTEQIQIKGHDYDYMDPRGITLRCKGRPWTVGFSDKNVSLHPADAEIGEAWRRIKDEFGRFKQFTVVTEVQADGGTEGETERKVKTYTAGLGQVVLDPRPKAVDLRAALPMINERFEPNDPEQTEEDVKKSQEGFRSMVAMESIMLLVACLAGVGAAWFIFSNTDSGGSSPVTVPITIVYNLAGVML